MSAMAIDEPPTSPSQTCSNSSQHQHFYVAVDRLQYKMETLVDLLGLAGRRGFLPIVVCCSTRDELDAVCSAVSNLSCISLSCLYSDQAEAERARVMENFWQATVRWNRRQNEHNEDESEMDKDEKKSSMIVVTDACLPLVSSGESPMAARVLINYELPAKKETYTRRILTCLASDGIAINMVVGGEVVTLKSLEEAAGLLIAEMPINVSEML